MTRPYMYAGYHDPDNVALTTRPYTGLVGKALP